MITWLKDFEKRAFGLIIVGFLWTVSWMGFAWIMLVTLNVTSNHILVNIFGVIGLIGFLFFQIWMILTITKGLYLQMFAKEVKE